MEASRNAGIRPSPHACRTSEDNGTLHAELLFVGCPCGFTAERCIWPECQKAAVTFEHIAIPVRRVVARALSKARV